MTIPSFGFGCLHKAINITPTVCNAGNTRQPIDVFPAQCRNLRPAWAVLTTEAILRGGTDNLHGSALDGVAHTELETP